MAQIEGVKFEVIYNGVDISEDISAAVVSISYTDNVHGKADEMEIKLEDSEGKWNNEWNPTKSDKIDLKIGFESELVYCGAFQIDETESEGPPDVFIIRGISSGITTNLRTKKSKANEGKTLQQLAQDIATAHNLTLDVGNHVVTRSNGIDKDIELINTINELMAGVMETPAEEQSTILIQQVTPKIGELNTSLKANGFNLIASQIVASYRYLVAHYSTGGIIAYIDQNNKRKADLQAIGNKVTSKTVANDLHSIVITRSTQRNETDLAYLMRVADDYGFAFSIKGSTMVFYNIFSLEGGSHTISVSKGDFIRYSFKSGTHGTAKSATVNYMSPESGELVSGSAEAETDTNADGDNIPQVTAEDTIQIKSRAEDSQQADTIAKSSLHKHNSKATQSSFSMPLNIYAVAGSNIKVSDVGKDSGTYHITSSTHKIEKGSGGVTECDIKKVIPPTKAEVQKEAGVAPEINDFRTDFNLLSSGNQTTPFTVK